MAKTKKKTTKKRKAKRTQRGELGWKRSNRCGELPDLISGNLP